MSRPVVAILVLLAVLPLAHGGGLTSAKPWIGIRIAPGPAGVLVREVLSGTPAERAGLQAGDQVLTINGTAVRQPEELIASVQKHGVGVTVELEIRRRKRDLKKKLVLDAMPDEEKLLERQLVGKPMPGLAGLVPLTRAKALTDLDGKVVVLDFWATWCGPCFASLPTMAKWHEKYESRGLRVLGVTSEEKKTVEAFLSKHEKRVGHPIALDPGGSLSASYYVSAVPTLIVIDRKGVVRAAVIGAGGKLDDVEAAFLPLLDEK